MGKRIFWYSYEKMYRELNRLRRLYPGRMTLETAGRSRDGRKIPRVILGAENAKYRVCVQAAIHGREYMNSALAVRQIRDYLSEERTDFFAEVCFCVFPMMNPDGVTICQKGITGIRNQIFRDRVQECFCRDMEIYVRDKAAGKKIPTGSEEKRYFRRWKANAGGVDLNRNFDAGWAEYNGRAKPSSEGCKGACPGSEPEARILINNVTETKYDCCISYHSAGNLIYWDFGSHGILRDKERRLAETVAAVTGYLPERAVPGNTDGAGFSDYAAASGIPAVTVENGSGECPLEIWEFRQIYRKNRKLWQEAACFLTQNDCHGNVTEAGFMESEVR